MNGIALVSIVQLHLKALFFALFVLALLYGIRRFSAQERYLALRMTFFLGLTLFRCSCGSCPACASRWRVGQPICQPRCH